MKYISLFAGIGGFDLALNRLGHKCVWSNEWDKYAAQIYDKNFSDGSNHWRKRKKEGELSSKRERVLLAIVARAVSTILSQHPYYVTGKILEQYKQEKYQTMNYLPQDFHVKVSQWLENVGDLMTPEELFSLKLQGYLKIKTQNISFLKMLKDCYLMTTEALSRPLSPRLMNWGMTSNGKCLTAKISESPKIGKECSLSDILEEQVDQKYFLSQKYLQGLDKGFMKPRLLEHCQEEDIQEDIIQA